jgi:hypothetical protein
MLTGRGNSRIRSCPFKNNRASNSVGYPMGISAGFVHRQVLEICECQRAQEQVISGNTQKVPVRAAHYIPADERL